jgi:hypothetical protein
MRPASVFCVIPVQQMKRGVRATLCTSAASNVVFAWLWLGLNLLWDNGLCSRLTVAFTCPRVAQALLTYAHRVYRVSPVLGSVHQSSHGSDFYFTETAFRSTFVGL